MHITEVLISYYTKAIADYQAESMIPKAKPKLKNKKIKKTTESTTMQNTNQVNSSTPGRRPVDNTPVDNTTVEETSDLLEEPVFGSSNSSWVNRMKKISPAAYQNLKNWD